MVKSGVLFYSLYGLKLKVGPNVKIKSQKIPNFEEISKRKVPNQMAKSKVQAHQTNEQQMSYA